MNKLSQRGQPLGLETISPERETNRKTDTQPDLNFLKQENFGSE